MTDLSSLAAALSALKTATDLAGIIRQSGVSLEQAEFKLKSAELITALADIKLQLADVQYTILERDKTIRELDAKLELKGKVTFKAPFCWLDGDSSPHCQQCYEGDGKLVHLQGDDDGYWECKTCKRAYRSEPSRHSGARVARNTRNPFDTW